MDLRGYNYLAYNYRAYFGRRRSYLRAFFAIGTTFSSTSTGDVFDTIVWSGKSYDVGGTTLDSSGWVPIRVYVDLSNCTESAVYLHCGGYLEPNEGLNTTSETGYANIISVELYKNKSDCDFTLPSGYYADVYLSL